MTTAIYPGTFDPVTNGHLDVLERACQLFEKVIVAIAKNNSKNPIFSIEKRLELWQTNIKQGLNAEVIAFDGLTVDLAKEQGAKVLIRGLRAVSDFEYEFQLAQMNRHMESQIETLFLMPSQEHFYTSSQLIKKVSYYTVDRIRQFVPQNVLESLKQHFNENRK